MDPRPNMAQPSNTGSNYTGSVTGSETGTEPMLEPEGPRQSFLEVVAPYIVEFVGTFLLVFTVGCCKVAGDATWKYTAIACMLMVLVYALGPVSGGHFNPSVSIACGLTKSMPRLKVLLYVPCQIAGAVLGGLAYYDVFRLAAPVKAEDGYNPWHVGICEVLYTAMICFVVLNVCTSKRNNPEWDQNHFFALAIGFVMIAGGYAAGGISGAIFNPAITLGLDITGNGGTGGQYDWRLIYIGYQILGSAIAALLYYLCRYREDASAASEGPSLQIHILAGHNLRNRDPVTLGEVSKPYVLVRVGLEQYLTPTGQTSSPVWTRNNVFSFRMADSFQLIELEVMDKSKTGGADVSLGTLNVHQQDVPTGEWRHWKERLVVGSNGEIEFEARVRDGSVSKSTLPSRALSEFLGTFMLVVTVGLNVVTKSGTTPFSAAAALMCMIYSLWNVSGAHFNPAVTLGVVLSGRGKCAPSDGAVYIIAQLLAGLLAGLLYANVHFYGPYKDEVFSLEPGDTFGWRAVFFAEFAFTFMLAFVVLAVATVTPPAAQTTQNFYFALAIGACVTAGGFAVATISGGEMNPAVSWGIATASNIVSGSSAAPWYYCIYFSGFELAGGVLAALIFFVTHNSEYVAKV